MIHLEEEIEELEHRDGDDEAQREKEVLTAVQGELVQMEAAAPDAGAVAEGAIKEIVHVGQEIEELERREGDADAELEKEVLLKVETELVQASLAPGCNLACFFDNHPCFGTERTKEKVLGHLEERLKEIGTDAKTPNEIWEHACDCRGDLTITKEMVHVEEEIEELENQDGEDAKLEKEVLESMEEGLIETGAGPPA